MHLQLPPIWTKVYFRYSSPQGTRSAEPLLPPDPYPDPNGLPSPSSHCQGFSYAMCAFPYPLALPCQCCRQPQASPQRCWASEPIQTSQHILFPPLPSLYNDNNKPALDDLQNAAKPSLHYMPSWCLSMRCHGADMLSCLLSLNSRAP